MAIDEYREIKRMKTTFPYILGTLKSSKAIFIHLSVTKRSKTHFFC